MLSHNILYENKNNIELKLISQINHFGNINSGHYNAIDYENNIIIDDDTIINYDIKNSKDNSNVYMLFYQTNFTI